MMNMKKEWSRKLKEAERELKRYVDLFNSACVLSSSSVFYSLKVDELKRQVFNFQLAANRGGE